MKPVFFIILIVLISTNSFNSKKEKKSKEIPFTENTVNADTLHQEQIKLDHIAAHGHELR